MVWPNPTSRVSVRCLQTKIGIESAVPQQGTLPRLRGRIFFKLLFGAGSPKCASSRVCVRVLIALYLLCGTVRTVLLSPLYREVK